MADMVATTAVGKGSLISKTLLKDLFRQAIRLTRSESDAWDLVQDTLERGLQSWTGELADERAMRWLRIVLRNRNLDRVRSSHWRALRRSEPDLVDRLESSPQTELPRWRTVDPQRVQQAMGRLAPIQREILLMQTRDQLSLKQIAAALHVPVATAGTRAHRARHRLRRILEDTAETSA